MKDFQGWLQRKEELHASASTGPSAAEQEVWWAAVGINVGSELDGKGPKYSRPVLILKKFGGTCVALPLTTQAHNSPWYCEFNFDNKTQYACLHQVIRLDYKRLYKKLGKLDVEEFLRIKNNFRNLFI